MVKVLVTGGAGFIGANLVRMLIEKSYQVKVIDNLRSGNLDYLSGLDLEFIKSNIFESKTLEAIEWADSIVHLAGQTSVITSIAQPNYDFEINTTGSLHILDACRILGTKRLLFASSNAAKQHNLSPYGASKRAAEGYCLAYNATYGLETIVLRLANVYGPYSAHKNSVVAKWFKDIIGKKEIIIEGGEQTRDFIHVADVCRAIIAALESNISGEIFQVGTGIETSVTKLAAVVADQIGGIKETYGDARQNDPKRSRASISKIGLMLHWQPSVKLADGLQSTWEWFNENSSSH